MSATTLWIVGFAGAVLYMASLLFIKPGGPRPSLNPKNWVPFWKMRSQMRTPGFVLLMAGLVLMWVGFLPAAIMRFLL